MKRFLTGIATGLAVSYLMAPRSGKDTRKQLTDTATKQKKALQEQWTKKVSQVKKMAKDVQESSASKPNLFAEMEAGKYDRFLTDAEKPSTTKKVEHNA